MATTELSLDEETLKRAQQIAKARHLSLEQLVAEALRHFERESRPGDGLMGLFANEPKLLDDVVHSAMSARERDPLRADGQSPH